MDVFIYRNGVQTGPYDLDDLEAQNITAEDYVWCKGMTDWVRADEAEITSHLFAAPTPEPDPSELTAEPSDDSDSSDGSDDSDSSDTSDTSATSDDSESSETPAPSEAPAPSVETELSEIAEMPEAPEVVPPANEELPPPVEQYQPPQPQAPQPQAPQYQAPQPQAPQYQAPQYQAPQYPQYPQPQYPQYQAPQYQQPQYQAPQYPQPQYQAPQPLPEPMPPCPSNYLWLSIVTLLCCCLPGGIVSLVYALKVNSRYGAGDYEGAKSASNSALWWGVGSVIAGVVFNFIGMLYNFASM